MNHSDLVLKITLWFGGGLLTLILLVVIAIVFKAWHEVRISPREVMIHCPVHGPIRKNQTITFVDVPYCYMCWIAKLPGNDWLPSWVKNGRSK